MQTYETLKHTTWDCKYPVVFITKCRKKALYGQIRRELGPVFRELAGQKECAIIEGHLMPDHVHRLVAIPPKYSVAQVVGFLKGKSAIHIARVHGGRRRSFVGQQFWARGYWVSTVGRDEVAVRRYIQEQEKTAAWTLSRAQLMQSHPYQRQPTTHSEPPCNRQAISSKLTTARNGNMPLI